MLDQIKIKFKIYIYMHSEICPQAGSTFLNSNELEGQMAQKDEVGMEM